MKKWFIIYFCLGSFFNFFFCQEKWSLEDCINYAQEHNLEVIQSKMENDLQEKSVDISKMQKLPSISGSLGNSFNFGQNVILGDMQRNDNFSQSINLNTSVILYNQGRLKKEIQKSKYDLKVSQYMTENVKNNIAIQVIQYYLRVLLNKEIYKINIKSYKDALDLFEKAKITTRVGTTPLSTQQEAEAEVHRKKQIMVNSEIEMKKSLFDLSLLLQLDDEKSFDIEDISLQKKNLLPVKKMDNFLDKVIENNPLVLSTKEKIKSKEVDIEIAKTSFYPSVDLGVGLGTYYFSYFNKNFSSSSNLWKQYKNNFGQSILPPNL